MRQDQEQFYNTFRTTAGVHGQAAKDIRATAEFTAAEALHLQNPAKSNEVLLALRAVKQYGDTTSFIAAYSQCMTEILKIDQKDNHYDRKVSDFITSAVTLISTARSFHNAVISEITLDAYPPKHYEMIGGKLMLAYQVKGVDGGAVIVFSEDKPASSRSAVGVKQPDQGKLHCWCVAGQLMWSERQPANSINVDALRANVTAQVINSSFRSTPNSEELKMINRVMDHLAQHVSLSSNLLSAITDLVVSEYNTASGKDIEEIVGFMIIVDERIRGGGKGTKGIDLSLFHSKEFAKVMELHLSDPENSQKFLNALRTAKPYNAKQFLAAYSEGMTRIKEVGSHYGDPAKRDAKVSSFITAAATAIKDARNLDATFVAKLADLAGSPFMHGAKTKFSDSELVSRFKVEFPSLGRLFEEVVKQQNVAKHNNTDFVNKEVAGMVRKLEATVKKGKSVHKEIGECEALVREDPTAYIPTFGNMGIIKDAEDIQTEKFNLNIQKAPEIAPIHEAGLQKTVEVGGKELHAYMVPGEATRGDARDRIMVFSTTPPKGYADNNVNLLPSFQKPGNLRSWFVNGQVMWSDKQPQGGVSDEKLRASITSQVINSSFRSTPTAKELEIIDRLVAVVVQDIGKNTTDFDKVGSIIRQDISKMVVVDYRAHSKGEEASVISEKTIMNGQQLVRFAKVAAVIAQCCNITPVAYVTFHKHYDQIYSQLQPLDPDVYKDKVSTLISEFTNTSVGNNKDKISGNLLNSKEFINAIKLHISDPENSKKLLDGLRRAEPRYNPIELAKAYITCMQNIQEIHSSFPKTEEGQNTAKGHIDKFIEAASAKIKDTKRIGDVFLDTLRDQMIADSPLITSYAQSRKMTDTQFAKDFGTHFPMLKNLFEKIIIQQNPGKFQDGHNQKIVDQEMRKMVGEMTSRLQNSAQKGGHKINAHHEFVVLETECVQSIKENKIGMLGNILTALLPVKKPINFKDILFEIEVDAHNFKMKEYNLEIKKLYPSLHGRIEMAVGRRGDIIKHNQYVADACEGIIRLGQAQGLDDAALLKRIDTLLDLSYKSATLGGSNLDSPVFISKGDKMIPNHAFVEDALKFADKLVEEINAKYPKVIAVIRSDLGENPSNLDIAGGINKLSDDLKAIGFVNFTGFRMVNNILKQERGTMESVLAKIDEKQKDGTIEAFAGSLEPGRDQEVGRGGRG